MPFETTFTLTVDKKITFTNFKCEFGYFNSVGKVVIPTPDTGDFLKQSQKYSSAAKFNMDTIIVQTKFPPISPSLDPNNTMSIYCQCWNQFG